MVISKLTVAKYLLIFFTTYQFLMGIIFLKSSIFYLLFSPYVLLTLFLLVHFSVNSRVARISNKISVLAAVFIILILSLSQKDVFSPNFLSFLLKSLQYSYGGFLVALGVFYVLSIRYFRSIDFIFLQKAFLKTMLILASSVTILEFIYLSILELPPEYLGHISSTVSEYNGNTWYKMRSFGIASYPQVSGALLSILVILYFFSVGKIDIIFMVGCIAIFLGMTGTGVFLLLMFLPLLFKKTITYSIITFLLFLCFSFFGKILYEIYPDITLFHRLSLEQFARYINLFIDVGYDRVGDFNIQQWIFGRELFSYSYGSSPTHDWAYLAIIIEYGFVGLFSYLIMYGVIIHGAIFNEISSIKKIYFLLMVLGINVHYPAINFYVVQFVFGILFALNVHIGRLKISNTCSMDLAQKTIGNI